MFTIALLTIYARRMNSTRKLLKVAQAVIYEFPSFCPGLWAVTLAQRNLGGIDNLEAGATASHYRQENKRPRVSFKQEPRLEQSSPARAIFLSAFDLLSEITVHFMVNTKSTLTNTFSEIGTDSRRPSEQGCTNTCISDFITVYLYYITNLSYMRYNTVT